MNTPSYLLQNSYSLIFGQEAIGQIDEIAPNPEIPVPENYLSRVSFQNKNGETISRQFRYAKAELENNLKQVHVYYFLDSPTNAALKEDAGYFWGTIKGLMFFIVFFFALLLIVFILDYFFKKILKAKTYFTAIGGINYPIQFGGQEKTRKLSTDSGKKPRLK